MAGAPLMCLSTTQVSPQLFSFLLSTYSLRSAADAAEGSFTHEMYRFRVRELLSLLVLKGWEQQACFGLRKSVASAPVLMSHAQECEVMLHCRRDGLS